MDQSTFASTITNLTYVQNLSFCYVACLTLLAYDFFLLIPKEIQYIWDSPWSVIKCLYFVQRYIPFLDVLLISLPLFIPDILGTTRILQNHSGFFILALGMAASEAILTLRAVAACGSSRATKITLAGIFIVLWTAVAVILAVGFAGGDGIICVFNGKKQCTVFHASNLLAVPFALLLLYDIMLVGMMSASAWRNYRRGPATNLSTALYRDGLIYYLYILVLTTTIVILIILHIGQNQNFLAVVAELIPLLLRIVHSAITSRVVIDIRSAIFADRAIREGGSKASSTDMLLSKS